MRGAGTRILLLSAVLVLLIAPISQALDRHDHYSARDAETNLCVMAAIASAGFWAYRQMSPPVAAAIGVAAPEAPAARAADAETASVAPALSPPGAAPPGSTLSLRL